MKVSKYLTTLASGLLILCSSLSAANAVTNPVGYIKYNLNPTSDARIGLSMLRPTSYKGVIGSVSSGKISISSTLPDVTTEAHFVWFNSGSLEGKWYSVTGATSSTLIVAENLQSEGLQSGDAFSVVPFWTLDTLFPNGGDVPKSADPFNPSAQVLLFDPSSIGINLTPSQAYIYYEGPDAPDSWYDANTFAPSGNVIINPESHITIRNSTLNVSTLIFPGSVPVDSFGTGVLSRSVGPQDNLVSNPYPMDITFTHSNLISGGAVRPSPDPFNPTDLVLLYSTNITSYNSTPSTSILYYSGPDAPDGWYDANTFAPADDSTIPSSGAFIIRRSIGNDELISWIPNTPYSL